MKKTQSKERKSIYFSKGVRGKYANMEIVVAGASNERAGKSAASKTSAEAVLKKISRVLKSAGSSKQELESAVSRARHLIDAANV